MAKKKRMTRKELLKGPDEFLTFTGKAIAFAREYQNPLLYGAIGVVAVVIIGILFQYMASRSEQKAFALFQDAMNVYMAEVSNPEAPGPDDVAQRKFAELIEQYGSSSAARIALPLYADLMYKAGEFDKAIAMYEKALDALSGDKGFEQVVWNGLGYAYEGKKEYATALEWFKKLADVEGGLMQADAYYHLGRLYEALNDKEKALEAYKKVSEEFGQSAHARLAKDKIARLQG